MSAGSIASQAFSPNKIADLNLDLDALDPSTIVEDLFTGSGAVSEWIYKSRSNAFIQFSGVGQPLTGVNTINGKNVIAFDGNNNQFNKNNFPSSTNMTLFIVLRAISSPSLLDSVLSMDDSNYFQIEAGIEDEFRALFRSANLGGSVPQPQHSSNLLGIPSLINYRLSANDSDVVLRVNGVQSDTDTYNGNLSPTPFIHIGRNRFGDHLLEVDIGQIIIYNRDLTLPEMLEVEKYLINRWDINIAFPSVFTSDFSSDFS